MKSIVSMGVVAALAGMAHADVIAYTSFENAATGDQYQDTGDAAVDHDLVNNAGQASVDFATDGVEMGFDAYYRNSRGDVGLTDGDWVGVTSFAGTVGSFTDGVQGYQLSDADGTMGVSFDTVTAASFTDLTMDVYVQSTGWESDDSIRIFAIVDGGVEVDVLNTIGSDVNDLMIEGSWMNLSLDLSGYTEATLVVELESNSGNEGVYLDNIVFNGTIPTPGSVALLAMGGLVGARRRRA